MPSRPLVGRDDVRAAVGARLTAHENVVLTGPSGIGKTAILDAVCDTAAARGELVLRVAGTESERSIPYSGIAELLEQLPPAAFAGLPESHLAPLDAVRRGEPPRGGTGQSRHALLLALRRLLAGHAARQVTLLCVDNAQWLDPPSIDALCYVARRFGGLPVRAAVAGTCPDGDAPDASHCPWLPAEAATEIPVPPLGPDGIAELLDPHGLPARVASALHADSRGNPRLALALAGAYRAQRTRVGTPVPLTGSLRTWLGERFAALPGRVRQTLLVAALADRPTVELLRRTRGAEADRDLRIAASAGLLVADGSAVCFTPPAVRSVIAESYDATRRAAVHVRLAAVVTDSAERVWHSALVSTEPDAEAARALVAAARTAACRGPRGLAAELYLLAAHRAPAELNAERVDWLVAAAETGAAAMRPEIVHRAADEVLAAAESVPAQRVRARMAVIDLSGQAFSVMDEVFVAALVDAEHAPELEAALRLRLSWAALIHGDLPRCAQEADLAVRLAADVGDAATESMALANRATVARATGARDFRDPLRRALAIPHEVPDGWLHLSARFLAARFAVFDDQLKPARDEYLRMLAMIERGTGEEVVEVLRGLSEISARLGRCREALDFAGRAIRIAEDAGLSPGPCWHSRAVAELAGGTIERAAAFARRGIQASEQEDDGIYLCRHLHVLAQTELRTGDARGAVATLRRLAELERRQGVAAPLLLRWHADLATALAATGELTEADAVIASTRGMLEAEESGAGVAAQLDRAEALVLAARGRADTGIELLGGAERRFRALGQPLELGHCHLVRGRLERRRRRHGAARAAVLAALRVFTSHEAAPWIRQAGRGTALVDAGGPHDGPATGSGPASGRARGLAMLTAAERRIARLVGDGASNQEAAAQVALSVKTVEASLTRIYRKLGVRSRTQLSSLLLQTDPDHRLRS
ncbi:AAA family ATPase [Streptomyces sp. MAR4 CNX-425]|uniref:AAA family ATPase n=1 Tax=Streptomyces sp. MAR4 CNX-425 TaxID=3406343 RepID=UPI003B505CBC